MSYTIIDTFKDLNEINRVIDFLLPIEGESVTVDPNRWDLSNKSYTEIEDMWIKAKFNPSSIKWTNYYPNKHFNNNLITTIQNFLQLKGIHRSWISRLDSGYYAPWHWDIDDNEQKYLEKDIIIRYSVILSEHEIGQIFILGSEHLIGLAQGTIFKWNNYKEWHSGINASMKPKFMLHILGY